MDENARTLFCGNLSDRVTEDVLYELFLQGGPVQRISIPRDRDGKQKTYGFVTYKHIHSVDYALRLFEGTTLYNRTLSMKPRNSADSQQAERSLDPVCHMNPTHLLQLGQQMILGNYPPQFDGVTCDIKIPSPYPSQLNANSGNGDRNPKRMLPYQRGRDGNRERDRARDRDRERDRNRDRDRSREWERNRERGYNDHHRDERSYYNRDNSHRSNDYPRYNDNRKRWSYH